MLDKCPTCKSSVKSSVIIETLISNEEDSESDISIDTTDGSSDDSGDKCDVTFYRWQILQKRIMKSKIDVPLNDAIHIVHERDPKKWVFGSGG